MRWALTGRFLRVLAFVTGAVTAGPAVAEPSAIELIELFRKGDVRTDFYLRGLGNGLSWANAELRTEGKTALFCPPDSTALTVNQEVDIMARHIERIPANGKIAAGGVLLFALQEAFPCSPK
jgi:hypothetical protein